MRPNSGRIEPGATAEVAGASLVLFKRWELDISLAVMLQPLKEEPPLNAKCKDKFLIQSTLVTPEKEQKPLGEIVRDYSL